MPKYQDLNTSYRKSNTDGTIELVDLQAIKKNLERLFTTGKGEVPFNRDYGTSLKNLLFENNLDPADIRMFLYMDITTFEPRVSLNPADIEIVQVDYNTYAVSCNFTVPSLNNIAGTAQSLIQNE